MYSAVMTTDLSGHTVLCSTWLPGRRHGLALLSVTVGAEDVASLNDREDAPLVGDQAEVDTHKLVGLWYALSPHNAEIVAIDPVVVRQLELPVAIIKTAAPSPLHADLP